MWRIGPLTWHDLAHGVLYRGQDAAELGVARSHHVEAAQIVEQALPHARPDLVGLKNHVKERAALHGQRAASRAQGAKMQETELALVA
jgi:hypothetical protein